MLRRSVAGQQERWLQRPHGPLANPTICDVDALRAASRALAGATIDNAPYEAVLEEAMSGDFVYFDPPYDPISAA